MEKTATIRRLNDELRQSIGGGRPPVGGARVMLTPGVQELPTLALAVLFKLVAEHVSPPGDDPYGEHDFGAVDIGAEKYFWKIDYYDNRLQYGSPDPSNPEVTTRVMTIMHASEY